MGAWEQAARCVISPHVGDQAQQQQRPLFRSVVHEPAGVTWWLEARIDVPPGIPRIHITGKSDDERTQVRSGLPGIRVYQLADGVEQARGVGCPLEAIPRRHTPDHRPSPSVRACEVDAQLLGCRATTHLSEFRRKGGTNYEIALPDELLKFRWLQHPTILMHPTEPANQSPDARTNALTSLRSSSPTWIRGLAFSAPRRRPRRDRCRATDQSLGGCTHSGVP